MECIDRTMAGAHGPGCQCTDAVKKREAMEQIIVACFRAGFEIGASREFRQPVEPIIEWDGLKPKITGYKIPVGP